MKKFNFFIQKQQNLSFIAIFLLVLAGIVCSCKPDPEPEPTPNPKEEEEIEYPIDVPFEVYDNIGDPVFGPCWWLVSPVIPPWSCICAPTLFIINSYEEMEEYSCCIEGNSPPTDIDFSKYTLLLAHGDLRGLDKYSLESFVCLSQNRYSLKVHLFPTEISNIGAWFIIILTDKLSRDAHVELVVEERYSNL